MKRILSMVFIAMTLAGCSDQAPRINLTGNWTDVFPDGRIMLLSITDSKGTLTGDGFIGNRDVTSVQGTYDGHFTVTATLQTAAGAVQLEASAASGESIMGDLNGAGFTDFPVILKR